MCRFDADDPVSMCQKNAAVAAAVNRTDLVQVKYILHCPFLIYLLDGTNVYGASGVEFKGTGSV